ncbi:MAG TPA: gliding motility protein GldN [Bacteroidales bacterium]|nr:gliding motility protein GldN [Bacteroidales bacterium]
MNYKVIVLFFVSLTIGPLLFAQAPAQGNRMIPRNGFFERRTVEERRPAVLPYVREADVLWARRVWQVIDLREKMNQPLYFPIIPADGRRSLMQVILDAIRAGEITAYDIVDDDFTVPLTAAQLFGRLERPQTIRMQRPTPPYEEFDTTITLPFNPGEVRRFRIKEDWFFDSNRSVMEARIIGISPVREAIDPITGEIRGDEPLFWIYFPEARQVLVRAEVFNRHNDTHRMSFDDLFIRRFFSSYIYKVSNVHDRRIMDYFTGIDALLEAQRARNAIRDFEQDLWHH